MPQQERRGIDNTHRKLRKLRKLLVYTGRGDVVRKLDEAQGSSVMSSEIIGQTVNVLEDFRRTDRVRHQEVMALVDEVLGDLRNAWSGSR